MSRIIVFGAGGRAGRATVAEARARGHRITAVVRDPAAHGDLAGLERVDLVAGDVTDADGVARLAGAHDAAVSAVFDHAAELDAFFADAAAALLDGLGRAGVGRLVSVGLASVLATGSGALLMDTPGYPQDYRPFYLAHAAGTEVLRGAATGVDWLVLSPSGDFDHTGRRSGGYRTAPAEASELISYADFALAVLDEVDAPKHHRMHLGVTS